jgi:uncharacterized membrane-anchored protein
MGLRDASNNRRRLTIRGQSTVETALLLAVVGLALVAFFGFIRNAMSHRIKVGADAFGHGLQYDGNRRP